MRNKYLIIFILISQIYQYLINNQQISFLLGKRFSNLILSKKNKISEKLYSILFPCLFTRNYYIYMFQHFNYSTFAPYLLISLQFLFFSSFNFSLLLPFPLKTFPQICSITIKFSSNSRTNGSILYLRNAISGWIERIRIHRAM